MMMSSNYYSYISYIALCMGLVYLMLFIIRFFFLIKDFNKGKLFNFFGLIIGLLHWVAGFGILYSSTMVIYIIFSIILFFTFLLIWGSIYFKKGSAVLLIIISLISFSLFLIYHNDVNVLLPVFIIVPYFSFSTYLFLKK